MRFEAAEARLLPDRFVAIGFRNGQEVARAIGSGIVEPLAVTLAPDAAAAQRQDVSGDGLEVDDAVRWTIDFDRAVLASERRYRLGERGRDRFWRSLRKLSTQGGWPLDDDERRWFERGYTR